MIEKVKEQVNKLLSKDNSGHGMDHINRVLTLSLKFAEKENADKNIVSLIALLHDVDDYKLFGKECQENLTNAKRIMKSVNIDLKTQKQILDSLKCIGYSKSLKGLRPNSIEGKIVSDADMCDALGAIGILRVHKFGLKINRPFFDKNIFPVEDTIYNYHMEKTSSTVNFIFEVLFKYKNIMLTESGKKEAVTRHQYMIEFLYNYFQEEDAIEWIDYLNNHVKNT